MQFKENDIKDLLSLAYTSAYANASGLENIDIQFIHAQFEDWYKLNRRVIQVKIGANVEGNDIFVHPMSKNILDQNTPAGTSECMFETYRGWEGKILGNARNGDYPAYRVRITGDGVQFITTTINVADIQPLENKKYFGYV